MKIAFMGAGGTGKTTLVEILTKELDLPIVREGVREYMAEHGITHLRELDSKATKEMQEYILSSKEKFEKEAEKFISDRSTLDNATYALRWCDYDKDLQDWLLEYVERCLNHVTVYDIIFFVPTGVIELEDDGVRSNKKAHQFTIQCIMEGLLVEAAEKHGRDCPTFVYLRSTSIEDRVTEVKRAINRIKLERLGVKCECS